MVLLKLVLHVETIRFAGIPKGKKAIADRRKRLDELADQVHSLNFFFYTEFLFQNNRSKRLA